MGDEARGDRRRITKIELIAKFSNEIFFLTSLSMLEIDYLYIIFIGAEQGGAPPLLHPPRVYSIKWG